MEIKAKELELVSLDVNSSQWARTTNLPVCYDTPHFEIRKNRVTAERATNCASEDCCVSCLGRGSMYLYRFERIVGSTTNAHGDKNNPRMTNLPLKATL